MLTGLEIIRQIELQNIVISPFDLKNVQPSSIDLRLGTRLLAFDEVALDFKKRPRMKEILIPEDGFVLLPHVGYLGSTLERTETRGFAPRISGKSSVGRRFLSVHVTAGEGDPGFCGRWTLELMAIYLPVRVYAGMRICQIHFSELVGDKKMVYGEVPGSHYQNQDGPKEPGPME